MQKTDKNIELVWYDDSSTDGTVEKGLSVLEGSSISVKPLLMENNRKRFKIPNLLSRLEQCSGDYIFFIEGDDFWVSRSKIQDQVALLEESGCDIAFNPSIVVNAEHVSQNRLVGFRGPDVKKFNSQEVIDGDGDFMSTPSLCIKRSVINNFPDWFFEYMPINDYPLQVLCSVDNGAIYCPNVMSAYTRFSPNSWSKKFGKEAFAKTRLGFLVEMLDLLSSMSSTQSLAHLTFDRIFRKYYLEALSYLNKNDFLVEKKEIELSFIKYTQARNDCDSLHLLED